MTYIYTISFDIKSDESDSLKIGNSLERVLGFCRVLLPAEPGYVTSRAYSSIDNAEYTHVIFMSEWQTWEELQEHKKARRMEYQVLEEFKPKGNLENLVDQEYIEVD